MITVVTFVSAVCSASASKIRTLSWWLITTGWCAETWPHGCQPFKSPQRVQLPLKETGFSTRTKLGQKWSTVIDKLLRDVKIM